MSDDVGLNEACGVFGCVTAGPWPSDLDVASITCTALVGLQHRGQESAGIVTSDGTRFNTHKGMGLVSQVFSEEHVRSRLKGSLAIGHTRYSTAGSSDVLNCQPFVVETMHGHIAMAHNGELVNAQPVKQRILQSGTGLSTGSDSELITQLLSRPPPLGEPDGPNWTARLFEVMKETPTAYSLVIMHKDVLYAVRDPFGNRPLCLGKLLPVASKLQEDKVGPAGYSNVEGWVVSSESCSFQSIGAKYWRDLLPGEIVCLTRDGVKSMAVVPRPNNGPAAFCIFEYVYFARSDSCFEGQLVYAVRERCGRRLAEESPVDADVVSTVPESATPAALGFSARSGIPYAEVLCKNRYVGRTFIQPSTRLRQLNVSMKFGVLAHNVVGKRIILIDDSIVRGNTMKPIIRLLKDSGAKEVHIRVASPPLKYPCYMGINIPTSEELIANKLKLDELANFLGADSVIYLTLDGLLKSVQPPTTNNSLNHDSSDFSSEPNCRPSENGDLNGSGDHSSVGQEPAEVVDKSSANVNGEVLSKEIGEVSTPNGCAKNSKQHGYCTACLSGVYPVPLQW